MARTTGLGFLVLLFVVACGGSTGGDSTESADADRRVAEGDGQQSTSTVSSLSASTVGNLDSTAQPATSGAGDLSDTSGPATAEAGAPSDTSGPVTAEAGAVLDPGRSGSFTSPSGNIACLMTADYGASCWISEKRWTIDQPSEPGCEEFDYGNAVDVIGSGVVFPCYSDFSWDPSAPALQYGNRMHVGDFACASEPEGVTCSNGAGQGFRLARAEVVVL